MPLIQLKMTVQMEDGETYDVIADQRDVAAWERQPFGCSYSQAADRLFTFMRWTAWHALRRTKQINKQLGWESFDAVCVEVTDQVIEDSEALNPGGAAPSEDI